MQPPYFLHRGFPPSETRFLREGTRGEGNKAAALEAMGKTAFSINSGGKPRYITVNVLSGVRRQDFSCGGTLRFIINGGGVKINGGASRILKN